LTPALHFDVCIQISATEDLLHGISLVSDYFVQNLKEVGKLFAEHSAMKHLFLLAVLFHCMVKQLHKLSTQKRGASPEHAGRQLG